MELRQLNYFRVVAETQNITAAAKQLYISQPALSTAISRLEKDIGVPMFQRAANRITLTEAGRCFLEYVNSTFLLLDEGVSHAKQVASRSSNTLRIASAFGIMRDIVADYCAQNPDAYIELTTCDTDQIISMLTSGEADIGLNLGPILDGRLNNQTLMESNFFIAFNQNHPLSRRDSVSLKELENEWLFCSNIARTHEQAEAIFRRAGCKCNILKLDEREVLFEAVKKGLGSVFCIPMICQENELMNRTIPGVVFVPIKDCEEKGRVVLVKKKDVFFTVEAEHFLSVLISRFHYIDESTRKELRRRNLRP